MCTFLGNVMFGCRRSGGQAHHHLGRAILNTLFMSSVSIFWNEWKCTDIIHNTHHTQITKNIIWCRQTIQLCEYLARERAATLIDRLIKTKNNPNGTKANGTICEYLIENGSHLWYVWRMNVYGQLVAFLYITFWASDFVLKIEHSV